MRFALLLVCVLQATCERHSSLALHQTASEEESSALEMQELRAELEQYREHLEEYKQRIEFLEGIITKHEDVLTQAYSAEDSVEEASNKTAGGCSRRGSFVARAGLLASCRSDSHCGGSCRGRSCRCKKGFTYNS